MPLDAPVTMAALPSRERVALMDPPCASPGPDRRWWRSHGGLRARSEDHGHLDAEGIRVAARERRGEEELRVRLHDQPRCDGQLVGDLEDGLAVSDRRSGHRLVLPEILGEASHGNRGAEDVPLA